MSVKRRKGNRQQVAKKENATPTLSDSLDDDVLAKLKSVKTDLTNVKRENEEKRQEKLRLERKEREKNKSFEELLNEYGDVGTKY
ncbi:YqkE family protein [Sporosarcina sp. Marseille-Q4063]|uniref:YqkE family protein n=1 Tax=Sporosarcina sp. Marseille-Q4063 TaxID=2810514 RepID=UPI001BB09894|nr:YqkE family protein [Sporosarcina sp. Marseille-Q4063]QUW21928.1 YqkE family protein [Sporosarcina sp. Marseille-Q4063]